MVRTIILTTNVNTDNARANVDNRRIALINMHLNQQYNQHDDA